jgi:hypothetical protein
MIAKIVGTMMIELMRTRSAQAHTPLVVRKEVERKKKKTTGRVQRCQKKENKVHARSTTTCVETCDAAGCARVLYSPGDVLDAARLHDVEGDHDVVVEDHAVVALDEPHAAHVSGQVEAVVAPKGVEWRGLELGVSLKGNVL